MKRQILFAAIVPLLAVACVDPRSDAGLLDPAAIDGPDGYVAADGGPVNEAMPSQVQSGHVGTDEFGTENIAPTAPAETEWSSTAWANGRSRTFSQLGSDPYDSMLRLRGSGQLTIHGDGTASVTGRAPRLYVQRPDQKPIWENVEVTYYAKRIEDDNPPGHAGFKIGARSWHGKLPWTDCNGRTYYGIAPFGRVASVTKELKHGTYAGRSGEFTWDDMPFDEWIGVKLVLRDTVEGFPHLMFYVDHTGGRDGGDWELVAETIDRGDWEVNGPVSGCNYDRDEIVTGKAPAVFARFDGVGRIDIRDFSVRTIEAEFDEQLFADVPSESKFATPIAWAKEEGITLGCNPPANTRFCPRGVVTREQTATFLARFLDLQPLDNDAFVDDDDSVHERNINAIAQLGVTKGCNPPDNTRFCPKDPVTREQMATFLQRALNFPASSRDWFDDDDDSIHEDAINRIADAGVTAGCAADRYCPSDPVTREQMVTFLYRAR